MLVFHCRKLLVLFYCLQENIVTDKQSGKDLDRPGYQALKSSLGLRAGDILYIKSLDRLSRNKNDIKQELQYFKNNKITVKVLDLPTTMVDLPNNQEWIMEMITNILIEVLASISEQERLTIRQRQREGIEAAHAAGKKFGRPVLPYPNNWESYYLRYEKGELKRRYAAEQMNLTIRQFKYLVARYKREQKGVE